MFSIVERVIRKATSFIKWLFRRYVIFDKRTVAVERWFQDRGDETRRLDYPSLTSSSIVFDLGGYKGDFAQAINDKYGCLVFVFEPHPYFYNVCIERFSENSKVNVFNFGLGDKDGVFKLSDSKDGSSIMAAKRGSGVEIDCQIKEIFSCLDELKISKIDLMKINIEGAEFPLLMHMIEELEVSIVGNFQVQFHQFVPGAEELRENISMELSKTHQRNWCYFFVWENWEKKRLS
ncbi:FkbM family methyltransferase [Shewanella sp.]|uniref:FkbM family methyltransferase n=1 Tax=Shewanella sp. TaxID=50422 RepID=UPI0040470CB1